MSRRGRLSPSAETLEEIARELREDGFCEDYGVWLDTRTSELVSQESGSAEAEALDADARYLFVPQAAAQGAGLRDFARGLTDPGLRAAVEQAMRGGRGGYRRVKDCLRRHGQLELWYDFEAARDRALAIQFLEEQGFEVVSEG